MSGRVLAAACLAQLMITLDVSVVNIALPAVRADLGLGTVGQQWVVTAYALPFAGFLLIGGRFADLVGVRTTFGGGMALFTAASVVAGAAPGPGSFSRGVRSRGWPRRSSRPPRWQWSPPPSRRRRARGRWPGGPR
ncbi:MFS transporter [Tsukamurella sp. PLM1]|uniref:MFS transporter n=1 Tax=Tsukamurella sp. PLM1 TaxID=2929795 RepID=UPI00204BE0D6|nr:MFS transporter [Tsukamurella sp. PLM1]BDH55509.1 hypothetical protein MTP03_04480 [Tsukamurella sp. PLM1]